jgi:antitoxin component YwqK of YwqJK toxin-antitoxin module
VLDAPPAGRHSGRVPNTDLPRDGVHEERHRDGSLRARGPVADGKPQGYWEWFRLDGTKLRSGHFAAGEPVGEWTTYDSSGAPYKVTDRG